MCLIRRKGFPRGLAALTFVAVIFIVFYITDSRAEIIHLKNKGEVKGTIKSESEQSIVVDIGFGTVAISKQDIESIEHREEKVTKAPVKKLWSDVLNLSAELKEVKKKKIEAVKYKSRHDRLKYKLINLEREISFLNSKFENLNDRLRRKKKDDIYAYNKLVAELNATNAKMSKMISSLTQTKNMKEAVDPHVSKYVSEYSKALRSLEAKFDNIYTETKKSGFSDEDEKYFYESMEAEISKLKNDFKHTEVGYVKRGDQVIVEALLNNRIKVSLILDTGASCVIVSRNIADQLGIKEGAGTGKGTFVVADGRKITATTFVLESVKVGDSRANNISAAISEVAQGPGVDGLLGMSFLNNFIFRIDAKGNKLVLEEFIAS
ncbi:MAG: retroviral-like aspartic protease family protein [Candidatus Omnitrophota bacterium]|nr:MAG: retroviral-like aspartic protease family protein [Candidatus Omnitrophota bacterium]